MTSVILFVLLCAAWAIYQFAQKRQRKAAISALRLKNEKAIADSHRAICAANLAIAKINRLVQKETPELSRAYLSAAKKKLHAFHRALTLAAEDWVFNDPWMDSFCRLETQAITGNCERAIEESNRRISTVS